MSVTMFGSEVSSGVMPRYTISLYGPDGDFIRRQPKHFDHDDHALDTVGWIEHPHAIEVHHGSRLVGRFLPVILPPGRR